MALVQRKVETKVNFKPSGQCPHFRLYNVMVQFSKQFHFLKLVYFLRLVLFFGKWLNFFCAIYYFIQYLGILITKGRNASLKDLEGKE